MRLAYPALLASLFMVAGCPKQPATITTPPDPSKEQAVTRDLAHLTIPPSDETGPALARLAARAEEGEIAAAWGRAHYLLDLFDDARFRDDPASRALLAAALGDTSEPPARGARATDAALSFLGAEVNRVLRIDRLHDQAQSARALIEFDSKPATARGQLFRRIGELKAVARGGPLAGNAELRLYGFCRTAFADAVRAPWARRMRVLAYCLYPLFSSDPAPYFADAPGSRPPPPSWRVLAAALSQMIETTASRGDRLALAAAHQREQLAAFLAANGDRLPELPTPEEIGAPLVDAAEFYDWSPMLQLGDGRDLPATTAGAKPADPAGRLARDIEALARPVQGDGRGGIALALAGQAPMSALEYALTVAEGAGAVHLELLVSVAQRLAVPPGDYWSGRLTSDTVARLAIIPVLLAPREPTPEVLANLNPHVARWDPARAPLGLHLVIGKDRWQLLAPTGQIAVFRTDATPDAPTTLRHHLARVRAAFGNDVGLVLVPEAEASYAAIIAAASAAARDQDGRPLFSMLAFDRRPPKAKGLLGRRIERRWRAKVTITPATLESRASQIRPCYQDLLDSQPALAGELRLELRDGSPTVVAGIGDKGLRACAVDHLGGPMSDQQIASATIDLRPN